MTEQIEVAFTGTGSGTAELTWGQHAIWRSWKNSGTPEWIGGSMPLDKGLTVGDITTLLGFIMTRHQALRTRFRVDPDGTPHQVVTESGVIYLNVIDAADDEDPAAVAAAAHEAYEIAEWDHENDWPLRMGVIRHRGIASHFAVAYSHLVIDGYGFEILVADLAHMGREGALPDMGTPPLEQARWQLGPAGRRQSAAALRAWERQLRVISPQRFDESSDKRDPRWRDVFYTSRAAELAVTAVADRTQVHTGTVLLAAYAAALARVSGKNPSMMRILISNRFRPGLGNAVSSNVQSALCLVDVEGRTFDEVVAVAFKAQLAAGMHGYYDPRDLWDLIDRISDEVGELDLTCYYNDRRRSAAQGPAGPAATDAEIRAALPLSRMRLGKEYTDPNATCYLHIDSVGDGLQFEMRGDTHLVSPAQIEDILRIMESVLVEAAHNPDVRCPVGTGAETALAATA